MQRSLFCILIAVTLAGAVAAPAGAQPRCPTPADPEREDFVRVIDNPYFPLRPGTTHVFRGRSDGTPSSNVVEVTHRTKRILGVTTTVVRDRAYEDGELVEDTLDWYAQDDEGNVWYFGEDVKDYENGQVVSTAGSFEAGVDGAKAGIVMPGRPRVGQVVHIEFARGVAEDCFQITSLNASVRTPFVSSRSALQRDEFTPLEPDVLEHKFYVRGVGVVREQRVGSEDENFTELVSVRGSGSRDHGPDRERGDDRERRGDDDGEDDDDDDEEGREDDDD